MDKLIAFINTLPLTSRDKFATSVGTSVGYIRKRASIGGLLSPATCVLVERETNGAVTRRDLRPDDYFLIWPDLQKPKATKTKK